jgi:hypothetical protein
MGLPRDPACRHQLFLKANVHRQVLLADTSASNSLADLAIIPRKATFWSQNINGFDVNFLLLDPQVEKSVLLHREVKHQPGTLIRLKCENHFGYPENGQYHGGYVDFEP